MTTPSSSSLARSAHLRFDGISVSFAERRVLTDISFVVSAGERVGLIGENGSGKSTLLRVAAGLLAPDSGSVTVNGSPVSSTATARTSIGLLHQAVPFSPEQTIAQALEVAVAPARTALDTLDASTQHMADFPSDEVALAQYARALERAELLDAWGTDAKIAATLAGLGLANIPLNRPTGRLSGGQRARLALAWLLLQSPEVLLLDEPTNHLDDQATSFLRRVLMDWPGLVMIASHDRAFLDETANVLVDLDPAPMVHRLTGGETDGHGSGFGMTKFSGSYSDYLSTRADARIRWERQFRDEQGELRRLRAATKDNQQVGHVDWTPRSESKMSKKFYSDRNAKVVARRVNDSRSRLEELEATQLRKPPREMRFTGLQVPTAQSSKSTGSPLAPTDTALSLSAITVTGRLAPVSVSLSAGQKLLVTGANGSGKSTLLKVIAGQLNPTKGTVLVPAGARIGMLGQEVHLPDPYDRGPDRTALQVYVDAVGGERALDVSLTAFGLVAPRDQNRPAALLSLGQQRRLELAIVLANPPELLLLDEPTNHLALSLVTELEKAIATYPGTVVIASHDRWLRTRWTGQTLDLNSAGPLS